MQDGLTWTPTNTNVRFPGLFGAIQYFASNQLQLTSVVSAKMGLGLRELPSAKGYTGSTVLLWKPGSTYARIIELDCTRDTVGRLKISLDHDDWPNLRVLQLLMADSPVETPEYTPPPVSGERWLNTRSATSHEALSTIPEESEQDSSNDMSDSVSDYLHHTDPELQRILDGIPDLEYVIGSGTYQ